MNRVYRLVWSDLTRAWVAAAEIVKGRDKRSRATVGQAPSRQRRLLPTSRSTLPLAVAFAASPAWALDINALPTGGKVVAGSASISQAANALTVQQSSQRAALDWQSFNIGAAASVNFIQPSSSAVALNRTGPSRCWRCSTSTNGRPLAGEVVRHEQTEAEYPTFQRNTG